MHVYLILTTGGARADVYRLADADFLEVMNFSGIMNRMDVRVQVERARSRNSRDVVRRRVRKTPGARYRSRKSPSAFICREEKGNGTLSGKNRHFTLNIFPGSSEKNLSEPRVLRDCQSKVQTRLCSALFGAVSKISRTFMHLIENRSNLIASRNVGIKRDGENQEAASKFHLIIDALRFGRRNVIRLV